MQLQVAQKSAFFQNNAFYGVDLTPLHAPATAGYFGQAGRVLGVQVALESRGSLLGAGCTRQAPHAAARPLQPRGAPARLLPPPLASAPPLAAAGRPTKTHILAMARVPVLGHPASDRPFPGPPPPPL